MSSDRLDPGIVELAAEHMLAAFEDPEDGAARLAAAVLAYVRRVREAEQMLTDRALGSLIALPCAPICAPISFRELSPWRES